MGLRDLARDLTRDNLRFCSTRSRQEYTQPGQLRIKKKFRQHELTALGPGQIKTPLGWEATSNQNSIVQI